MVKSQDSMGFDGFFSFSFLVYIYIVVNTRVGTGGWGENGGNGGWKYHEYAMRGLGSFVHRIMFGLSRRVVEIQSLQLGVFFPWLFEK